MVTGSREPTDNQLTGYQANPITSISKPVLTPPAVPSKGAEPVILNEVKNRKFKAKDFQHSNNERKEVAQEFLKQHTVKSLQQGDEYVISLTKSKDILYSKPFVSTNRMYPHLSSSLDSVFSTFPKTSPQAKFQIIPPIEPSKISSTNMYSIGNLWVRGKVTFQNPNVQKILKITTTIFSSVGFVGIIGGLISSTEEVKFLTIKLEETNKNFTFLEAHLYEKKNIVETFHFETNNARKNEIVKELEISAKSTAKETNVFDVNIFNTTKYWYSRNSDYF